MGILEGLPNLRDGLIYSSGFLVLFCLGVTIFTAWSRRVQSETYNFTYGQWFSIVGMFIFAILFTVGYSLPFPAQVAKTPQQQRVEMFSKFFDPCMNGQTNTSSNRTDCMLLARDQTDIALGVTQMITKVVTRTTTIDHDLDASRRQTQYQSFFDHCMSSLPGSSQERPQAEQDYCNRFADIQTDAAFGVRHTPDPPQQVVRIQWQPTPYIEAFKTCMGTWTTDRAPDPVAARNARIQMCHAQAKEVTAAKM